MSPSSEQYAQLAALFTTGESAEMHTSIELLLPAHLPVQGELWLVPYAGREAAQGLCVLVRMHEDAIDVAVIGKGSIDISRCTSIEEVIHEIKMPVAQWIVQPPSDADPTSLLHCDADCVTLLSGADQAAVVGAYRMLKGLIAATKEEGALPTIQLVIVGAEERASSDAATRIIQTAHHQLGVKIDVAEPLPAMNSSNNVLSQVSFARTSNMVDFMSRLRLEPVGEELSEELPLTHRFNQVPEEIAECVAAEGAKVVEPMESAEEPSLSSENTEILKNYASHIQGLLSIAPRCPAHEDIELAVDSNGVLQILASAEDFREATIVAGWARKHQSIISMACGGLRFDDSKPPIQHLFTDDAIAVVDLHGSGVKLHLLAKIEVAGSQAVFSAPLN